MNDDLEKLFKQKPKAAGRPAKNPGLRPNYGPRVQGGPCLDGAPNLESLRGSAEARPAAAPPAEKILALHGPHAPARPRDVRSPRETKPAGTAGTDAGNLIGHQLVARRLSKTYRKASLEIPVLRGVDLKVRHGEFLAVVGQSGSGKSTLLHLLGTLDAPTEGEVHFEGHRIDNLPAAHRDRLRNRQIGMIFQFYHLLPELSMLENVLAPLMIGSGVWDFFRRRREHRERGERLLELMGLGHRARHKPRELSGGEMQRAAIARALVAGPKVLLADEPTGNLDQQTGREILDLLRGLNEQENLTIVMVTHDQAIAESTDRVVRLVDGRVEEAAPCARPSQ